MKSHIGINKNSRKRTQLAVRLAALVAFKAALNSTVAYQPRDMTQDFDPEGPGVIAKALPDTPSPPGHGVAAQRPWSSGWDMYWQALAQQQADDSVFTASTASLARSAPDSGAVSVAWLPPERTDSVTFEQVASTLELDASWRSAANSPMRLVRATGFPTSRGGANQGAILAALASASTPELSPVLLLIVTMTILPLAIRRRRR